MERVFVTQLILSVIIGGIFVALQSLIAEKVSQKLAGIVLSVPSTLAIALYFMGLTVSPSSVAKIMPVIPISFGIGLLFCCAYVYVANKINAGSVFALLLSTVAATVTWLTLAVPLAVFEFDNLALSFFGYAALILLSHYLLSTRPNMKTRAASVRYTTVQKLIRASVGGCIIGFIIVLAKYLGPFWGGIFSSFPAVYLSTLLIIHRSQGPRFLFHITKALPVASPVFIIYALVVGFAYPTVGLNIGTALAFLVSMAYPLFITFAIGRKKATSNP